MTDTYEVRCSVCGFLRWPRLSERPTAYICARCRSVPPEKRQARAESGRKAAATAKRASVESPDALEQDLDDDA